MTYKQEDRDVEDLSNFRTASEKSKPPAPSLIYQLVAEAVGTLLIIVIGLSSVNSAILTGSASGSLQVGIMFALGIMLGIYTAGPISGGHLNPAITLAIAVLRRRSFQLWKVPMYWAAQYIGGFIGAAINYVLFYPALRHFERIKGIVRGKPESDLTFALFGAVFPFPTAAENNGWEKDLVKPGQALLVEAVGSGIIVFLVFALLDERNMQLRNKNFAPVLIGLSAGALNTNLGVLTGGSFNPARDGGPRLFGAVTGWGRRAYPGNQDGFWVYLVGPCLGGLVAGAIYDFVLSRAYLGNTI